MNNPTHGTITISIETYDKLLEAERLLEAMQEYGVDSWEYYDLALQRARERRHDA